MGITLATITKEEVDGISQVLKNNCSAGNNFRDEKKKNITFI